MASAVLVGLVLYGLMTPLQGRTYPSHGPLHKCGLQMRGLAYGFRLWADDHDGKLPVAGDDWVGFLVENGYLAREMLTSPNDPVKGRVSYVYVPAESLDPTGDRVLLYEVPGLHDEHGVHIAFNDGLVELYPAEEAARIIESLSREGGTRGSD